MNEVFEVKILQNGDYFLSEHENCFWGEAAVTMLLKCIQRSIQLLKDDEVIVFFLSAPMHMRNSCSTLHYLEDFTLL